MVQVKLQKMRILVLMKRFGANKDMPVQDFGRQIRLFEPLAKRHEIDFLCPDYIKKESKMIERKGIRFIIRPIGLFSIFRFFIFINELIKKEKYDLIFAGTDPLIGILGHHYSRKFKKRFVYDLQDNFESYGTFGIPLVPAFHKKAINGADAVISVSETLKNHIKKERKNKVYVIPNGIDRRLFMEMPKRVARKKLRLPIDARIIAYIGHLEKLKGFDIMMGAFEKVLGRYPDSYLLLSGQVDRDVDINHKRVIYRKFPERKEVVLGINAADVAIIPSPRNGFTEYCFPYKLVEYMACGVPIVATDIGDAHKMLKGYGNSLCVPNDPGDLAKKIISKLGRNIGKIDYSNAIKALKWEVLAAKLGSILDKLGK